MRHAVVMAGGGSRGAYGAGVMKALCNGESRAVDFQPIDPAVVAGTSVGAFNAALWVSHAQQYGPVAAADYLEQIWTKEIPREDESGWNRVYRARLDPTQFADTSYLRKNPLGPALDMVRDAAFLGQNFFRHGVNFMISGGDAQRRVMELIDLSPFFSTDPLAELIGETIDFGAIRRSPRALRIAATHWKTGGVRIFQNTDMTDRLGTLAILASASVPAIFSPVDIDGEPYVDGGVVMNTPLKPALEAGADVLHVIYQDPDVEAMPIAGVRNMLDTMNRMLVISLAVTMNRDIQVAAQINEALTALDRAGRGEAFTERDSNAFVFALAELQRINSRYRKVTIHRYHPHDDLGGITKMLSFPQTAVTEMLNRGFTDTLGHDCQASECILVE